MLSQSFRELPRKDKTFQNVDVNLKFNKPEYDLSIDRMRVRDLGLNTADVAQALQAAFSGARSAYFIMNDRQYQVITQVPRVDRNTPTDIDKIYVRNNRGEQIPISSVLTVEENSNPPNLYH
jgi:HAE1 family hydrophobic/amphiphilic exporter-1/multidrug efflux pump